MPRWQSATSCTERRNVEKSRRGKLGIRVNATYCACVLASYAISRQTVCLNYSQTASLSGRLRLFFVNYSYSPCCEWKARWIIVWKVLFVFRELRLLPRNKRESSSNRSKVNRILHRETKVRSSFRRCERSFKFHAILHGGWILFS